MGMHAHDQHLNYNPIRFSSLSFFCNFVPLSKSSPSQPPNPIPLCQTSLSHYLSQPKPTSLSSSLTEACQSSLRKTFSQPSSLSHPLSSSASLSSSLSSSASLRLCFSQNHHLSQSPPSQIQHSIPLPSLHRIYLSFSLAVHQPSSEVFALFDDLFLLSGGGTVYFGEAKTAIEFFAEAGVPCPSRRNPSDHFLRCINSDFDIVTATLKGSQRIREGHVIEMKSGSQASWWKQLSTLLRRSSLNMSRDVGYYWLRIIIYILVSICVGTIYFDVGNGYTAIFARAACGAFITGFMTFMSIGGFPSFIEEMKVFYRERLNGYYGVSVFIISNFLSSFPFLAVVTLTSGTITYYLVKFRAEFSHYVYFCLNILACISVIESLMMVVASLVPNFLMGIITGAGIMGILMMTSGFFRLLPDLPKPFWRYPVSYLSYGSWAIQGAYKNDFLGLEFDPMIPGDPKLTGDFIIQHMFGIPIDHSKWWDFAAIVAILVLYRVLFFVILKFKENASPLFQTLYAKRTLQQLNKRPSFRKLPSISSKRHQPLHALSSQEGLNSPLQ